MSVWTKEEIQKRILALEGGATGGGSGIPQTLLDAKGDLLVASANDIAARLGVGADRQALIADSAQLLGVKWATVSSQLGIFNVKDYGAKGDNSTDDRAAIQAAIDAAVAIGGGQVFLPTGIYRVSAALTWTAPNISIIGAGTVHTIVRSTSTTADVFSIGDTASWASISHLGIDRTALGSNPGRGIYVSSTGTSAISNITLSNLWISNHWRGIYSGPCVYGTIENCVVEANGSDGLFFTNNSVIGGVQYQINNVISQRNGGAGFHVFSQNTGAPQITCGNWRNVSTFGNSAQGIALDGLAACPIHDFRLSDGFLGEDGGDELRFDTYGGSHIVTNTFIELSGSRTTGPAMTTAASHTGHGIAITANNADVSVTGGYITGNSQSGIWSAGTVLQATGVYLNGNGTSATAGADSNSGIYLSAGEAVVSGCYSAGQENGIYAAVDALTAVGNRSTGSTTNIGSSVTLSNSVLVGNRPSDRYGGSVASATALVIPRGADVVTITGTTAITSITTAAGDAGRRVTLIFAGILTFTDGSNLKLAGNFVTTADDTISLVCDGTNWFEMSRSVN